MNRMIVVGAVMLTAAARPSAEFPCGKCLDWAPEYCEGIIGEEEECHAFGYEDEGQAPRGTDMHIFAGSETQAGWGSCAEEHAAPCYSEIPEDAEATLVNAVASRDAAAVRAFVAANPNAWLEVNHERSALQILATCGRSPEGKVVSHISIEDGSATWWAALLEDAALESAPPESR